MKYLIILLSIIITGCSDKAKEIHFSAMPVELADCRIFELMNNSGKVLNIVRCPNSTTSTRSISGKVPNTSVLAEDMNNE